MPVERAAGVVLFRDTPEGRVYLVIRSSRLASTIEPHKTVREFWDLPKGCLEKGEQGIDAARRETEEEVGICDWTLVDGFKMTTRYFTRRDGKAIPKFVVFFLGEAHSDTVRLSWEHDQYLWLPHKEARALLTLKQMQEVLDAVEQFLQPEDKSSTRARSVS